MNHPGLWFLSQHHWSVPRHVTLWQKMLLTLPVVFPLAVLTTREVYSGSLEEDMSENHPAYSSVKWEVLPGHGHVQVASIYGKGSFESRSQAAPLQASTGWNFHESPWLMIPIPASLVCPKTCDTVAEDAFNIASSLSIGRTHDERGIFRQSWRRHVREPPSLFKCEVRSPSRARPRAGCKYIWERLVWKQITSCTFTSKYWVEHSWITLAYDSYPSIIGLSQDIWHCGRRRL